MEGFIYAAIITLALGFGFSLLAAVLHSLLKKVKKEKEDSETEAKTAFAVGLPLPEDNTDTGNYEGPGCCTARLVLAENKDAVSGCCLAGGDCLKVCKTGAICLENGCPIINPSLCTGCGACLDVCPQHIIIMKLKD